MPQFLKYLDIYDLHNMNFTWSIWGLRERNCLSIWHHKPSMGLRNGREHPDQHHHHSSEDTQLGRGLDGAGTMTCTPLKPVFTPVPFSASQFSFSSPKSWPWCIDQVTKVLLEKWYWWIYLQGRNGDDDVENRLMDTVEERESGVNGESSLDIFTIPCVKYIAGEKSLNKTGSPAWHSVMI